MMLDVLSQFEVFQDFPRPGLAELAREGRLHWFPAGSPLVRQGEMGDTMYLITTGRVRVERSDPRLPAPLVLADLGPGEVIGEMGILERAPRSATVIAIEDTMTMELTTSQLIEIVERVPAVAGALLRLLSGRLRATDRLFEEAAAGLHREREILNWVGDATFVLDPRGMITYVNPTAAKTLGYEPEELVSCNLHSLVHRSKPDGTACPQDECPVCAALRSGTPHRGAGDLHWRKDGSSFPVEYESVPMTLGDRLVGAVVTFRDITERLAAEQMKNEFVSVVSHELRTPLTSIRGSLGLVASGQLGPLPDQAQRMMEIAVNNTDRLVRLINDLLDLERMEYGKAVMERVACDSADIMTQATDVMGPMAAKAGVTLSVEPLQARVWADPDRILQTLANLLSNAIKFSPTGGTIWLTAELQGDWARFRVKDQGRGIPADRMETIFERFQQVDSSDSREKGGAGLGLPICRNIVHQHGGDIWVESTPGAGSTFCFTLPLLREEEPAVPEVLSLGPPVVVCGDDPYVLEMAQAVLEQQGYWPVAATSSNEAVELSVRHEPAAILVDCMMREINAWEIMVALKERSISQNIPIITFSVLTPASTLSLDPDRAPAPAQESDAEPRLEAVARGLREGGLEGRILIVENDPDLAQVVAAVFERHGVETFHARTGREAIRLAQRVAPNLLVLDLVLPEADGYAVADWLRQHDRLRTLPLVVYTATDLDASQRERLRLGETIYLTKGRISPEAFEQQVVGLLDRIVFRRRQAGAHVGEADSAH